MSETLSEQKENSSKKLVVIAFFLSGMTALIYEVVWSRPLQLIFGSTIYAVSTILTTFLAGFGIGAYIFGNIADNSKNELRLFSMLELGIGIYGLGIFYLFSIASSIYLNTNVQQNLLLFTLIFLVLIIPATLFGAIWPVVNKAYVRLSWVGKDVGLLYAVNSFGAALGPIMAGFILTPFIGIKFTSIIASVVNILIAIALYADSTKKRGAS